ncbi:Integral membrane protein [Sodalis praecaptivus]|uniref:Integral membrane protein n=2 Tax=Sodalis praecaptivus TaxID=1239307 RepID=K7SKC5_9GAMM|nr:EamA family transporter [Sodalis praecaptivus]AFW03759.1 integral membrane protein [Sodalis praecaptivus]AHF77741.1 Integral membrane protein [Sodalis praecaptivus]
MPILLALLAPILWGSTYATVGLFLQEQSPVWVAVWRALPAGILLLMIHPTKPPLPAKKMLALSFCNIAAFFLLLFIAAYRLPGSIAGTLSATMPLQVMLLRWLQEGKRPSWWMALLSLAGIAGVALLFNPSSSPDPVGVAAALAATLLIAQSTLWMSRWQYRDALALTAWQLLLGGMMLLPVALTLTGPPALPRPHAWPGLIWLVLANSALAYWCWVWALNRFGPAVMSIVSLLNPLSAVLLGVMLLPERLSWPQWLGIALILLAVLLMKIPTAPRRPVRAKAVRGVPPAAAADRPEGSSKQR